MLKEFDKQGKLIGTNEYIIRHGDTIFQGKFLNYNNQGIKIAEGNFINNEINGKCIYYYNNGQLKSVHYRKSSEITLESKEYYYKGKEKRYILYDYGLFDDYGKPTFSILFNENGKIKNIQGKSIIEIYQLKLLNKDFFKIKENQYLKIGDTLVHKYLIANIPNAKRSFKIENISVDNSKVKRTLKHIEPCQWDVEEILTKKGKNTIRSIVKYEFKDMVEPKFLIDTVSFDIEVH
ncbi:hypothetical protein [Flavobacterium columnare]|uniref:MORN repeat variant n=1 Tax=Flavobacterium columnare TaxID=996 RepID=A0AA94JPE9_9FLAO|nr:hypothetical protein [Flavobacterium columnare]MCH4828443.1 hypothetical protein [Flavobacterium columnare]MCH4832272.1 hypothetical protein [Flavobacterium columnare]